MLLEMLQLGCAEKLSGLYVGVIANIKKLETEDGSANFDFVKIMAFGPPTPRDGWESPLFGSDPSPTGSSLLQSGASDQASSLADARIELGGHNTRCLRRINRQIPLRASADIDNGRARVELIKGAITRKLAPVNAKLIEDARCRVQTSV